MQRTHADTRPMGILAIAVVELTLLTAYIHLTLGGVLFTLNAIGYAALAAAMHRHRDGLASDMCAASTGCLGSAWQRSPSPRSAVTSSWGPTSAWAGSRRGSRSPS